MKKNKNKLTDGEDAFINGMLPLILFIVFYIVLIINM